jgi:hypothetical protein
MHLAKRLGRLLERMADDDNHRFRMIQCVMEGNYGDDAAFASLSRAVEDYALGVRSENVLLPWIGVDAERLREVNRV